MSSSGFDGVGLIWGVWGQTVDGNKYRRSSAFTAGGRPHELVGKAKLNTQASRGSCVKTSADSGSRRVGQPSQKYVFFPSTRPPAPRFRPSTRSGGGREEGRKPESMTRMVDCTSWKKAHNVVLNTLSYNVSKHLRPENRGRSFKGIGL